jgi:hypothetical protein
MKRNLFYSIVHCCLGTILLYSCASYNYDSSRSDKSFTIKSDNQVDFVVTSIYDGKNHGIAIGKDSKYVLLEELKKKNLNFNLTHPNYEDIQVEIKRAPRPTALVKDVGLGIFTFGIPVAIDLFNSDFYMISKSSKEINVHFEYKQSFMIDEYQKVKSSTDPLVFEKWISNYGKSTIVQDVIDHKDSLELSIALSKESEQAIDDYISSHQGSNYLKEAEQIKSEMILARELFEKTKIENSVSSYENFLAKYPKSIHNTEAHKRLIDAAEKVALASASSTKMASYINSYIIPNTRFLTKSELGNKTTTITKAIDAQLIKENIKSDPKKTYEYYSNLWKSYVNIKSTVNNEYLGHLEQTHGYQIKICNQLFSKLKEANTQEKQTALVSKIKSDFPNLDINDSNVNPIIVILENSNSGSGTLKLFNVGYLPHYFDNLSERDALKGRDFYTYRGSDYQSLKGITTEELNFLNGHLNGVTKAYAGGSLDFMLNIGTAGPKEIAYYQKGQLVKTTTYYPDLSSYDYEFINGENITLKEINQVVLNLTNIEKNAKKHFTSGNYELAILEMADVLKIVDPAIKILKDNPIPKEKAENLIIAKARILDKLLNDSKVKIQEKEDLLEQQRISEAKRLQLIADQNPTFNNGHKKYVRKNENGNWSSIPCYYDGEWQCWYCGNCVNTKGSGGWSAIPGSYSNTCDIRRSGQYCSKSCASSACLADL